MEWAHGGAAIAFDAAAMQAIRHDGVARAVFVVAAASSAALVAGLDVGGGTGGSSSEEKDEKGD